MAEGLHGLGYNNNHETGSYHCHRGPNAGQNFLWKEGLLQGLSANDEDRKEKLRVSPPNKYFTGKRFVTDGDMIRIDGYRIRLHGIDAPEMEQVCKNSRGSSYRCGWVSKTAL